ncbi:MAG: Aldehyde Dehydrogenase [Bacteroidetes bacterium]|nr:Aldehyde Dehydrogenase [Bacteroidota bacterium]
MDHQKIITAQQLYFSSDETKNIVFRKAQLKKLKALLIANEPALCEAIYKDFKKSTFETYATELSLVYHEIDTAVKKLARWSSRQRVATNMANFPAKSYIIPEPLGVTFIMGAWNYPYQLSLAPVVAAMAAGNTIILKPSEIPVHSSAILAKLINEHFPPDYFTVIEGGVEVTTGLLKLKFDKIFFTGSTTVGKIVYKAAAEHLTPVTLELGGKSPAFVLKDCNINRTAQRLVWAKFLNAGQTCIAPDYVLVDQSIEKEFLEALKKYIQQFYSENNFENYVQIINDKNFERLLNLIEPNKIYFGGNHNKTERYIAPTILQNVSFNDKVMQEEIFGPILPVITFTDLNKITAEVKQHPKPLSCYVFSNNTKQVEHLLHTLSFGGGAVNDAVMHISNGHLPFGGVGNSGMGNYHGEAGFKAFSHYKSILHKPFWFEANMKYAPYTSLKLKLIKKLLG